jgi:hypothetical protein
MFFKNQIYAFILQNKNDFDRIMDIQSYDNYEELEEIILERLNKWEG